MKQKTLCVVASGSGGHILPALILARDWYKQNPDGIVIFCTGTSDLDKKIISAYPFIAKVIYFSFNKFKPEKKYLYPLIFFQILRSLCKSFLVIIKHWPTKIISTGGLIAIPLCFIGRLLGRRIELYELNVIPGKAIKFLMPFAHVIFTPFKITAKYCYLFGKQFTYKCRPCNYPIRFTEQDNNKDKAIIINIINKLITPNIQPFTHVRKTLFLLGGSQGSLALNNALKDFLQKHTEEYKLQERIQIIHQTGTVSDFDWTKFYRQLGIAAFTFSYHAHVEDFYVLADLVLCRAGAGTIFEVAFFEKQCIVIPLIARSTTHQIQNAQEIVKQYPLFFTLIEQKIITTNPGALHELILKKLSLY